MTHCRLYFQRIISEPFPQNIYFATLTTKQTFQATNSKQCNPQSSLSNLLQHSDTVHPFNVKPIKILSDPVAEAFGLIHRHPPGENFFHPARPHSTLLLPFEMPSIADLLAVLILSYFILYCLWKRKVNRLKQFRGPPPTFLIGVAHQLKTDPSGMYGFMDVNWAYLLWSQIQSEVGRA